jgi:hypothetical protein
MESILEYRGTSEIGGGHISDGTQMNVAPAAGGGPDVLPPALFIGPVAQQSPLEGAGLGRASGGRWLVAVPPGGGYRALWPGGCRSPWAMRGVGLPKPLQPPMLRKAAGGCVLVIPRRLDG